jgi:hypothetical protein
VDFSRRRGSRRNDLSDAAMGSFVVTGLVVSVVAAQLGIGRRQGLDLDEQATFILCNQL